MGGGEGGVKCPPTYWYQGVVAPVPIATHRVQIAQLRFGLNQLQGIVLVMLIPEFSLV